MSDRNKVEVKIRGRFFTITANEPEEYIYKICSYVDRKNGRNPTNEFTSKHGYGRAFDGD